MIGLERIRERLPQAAQARPGRNDVAASEPLAPQSLNRFSPRPMRIASTSSSCSSRWRISSLMAS